MNRISRSLETDHILHAQQKQTISLIKKSQSRELQQMNKNVIILSKKNIIINIIIIYSVSFLFIFSEHTSKASYSERARQQLMPKCRNHQTHSTKCNTTAKANTNKRGAIRVLSLNTNVCTLDTKILYIQPTSLQSLQKAYNLNLDIIYPSLS